MHRNVQQCLISQHEKQNTHGNEGLIGQGKEDFFLGHRNKGGLFAISNQSQRLRMNDNSCRKDLHCSSYLWLLSHGDFPPPWLPN